jgi:hypothetical protein
METCPTFQTETSLAFPFTAVALAPFQQQVKNRTKDNAKGEYHSNHYTIISASRQHAHEAAPLTIAPKCRMIIMCTH